MPRSYALKRPFDFCLALTGLILSFPLWALIGFFIWLEDGRPLFYLQERVGENAKIFKGIKFRSMIPAAEEGLGPVQAKIDDPRITKIGKILRATALDELPQLINILKDQMSFVGPRALRPKEIENHDNVTKSIFDLPGFKERSAVKPGLTGAAQVFASRSLTREEKFKYDLWYIENMSFWLDIKLVFKSFLTTFKARWDR
jgi:lipopolysaccharide/colanic/teichoic acid biosynthesis glycosyltransferase